VLYRLWCCIDSLCLRRCCVRPVDDRSRSLIHDLVAEVSPLDAKEASDQSDILGWVASGAPLFRVERPATPSKHLAVYFALLDDTSRSILLVDHVKAQSWLLPGGHVDDGEDPRWTVEREAFEELGIIPKFHERVSGDKPFFVTVTRTRGPDSHTDVTLWFVLQGDRQAEIQMDVREANEVRWFGLDQQTEWPVSHFDPQMHRFAAKLTGALNSPASL
jgi:8-oxo-dGTP diphosphatase